MLMGLVSVTSCTKEDKTVANPKPQMHTLTVTLPDGHKIKIPVETDQDATIVCSEKDRTVTITKADGTVTVKPLQMASDMDPEVKKGIQEMLDSARAKEAQASKPLTSSAAPKGGSWKEVAHYLQNGYKKEV